ncbi:hypothetical protein [Maribacter sp. ACAM166]|uniref:hypothetical protein n=1 Tax=Maribacter sp. ACAM166 TaxID=2508996 RepID=UPI0010FE2488|nr:hypothetical protein [Maribacter sp. ACAM166]TLP81391.1 hypothetical protein ES765_05120 [Maribacter sp. ACAM166]
MLGRLDEYLKLKKVSYYKLEKALDVSRGSISGALKNGRNLGANVVENILLYFPKLSAEWLLRGIGSAELVRPNTLQEPEINYVKSSDEWLINQTITHFKMHNKSELVGYFERLNENSEKNILLEVSNKLEKLDATIAGLMMDMNELKKKNNAL